MFGRDVRLVALFALGALSACRPEVQPASAADVPRRVAVAPSPDETHPDGAVSAAEFGAAYRDFGSYWYQGLAEMNRYALSQSRYGEAHDGEAVLIFVTEDFLTDVQTKHEFGESDAVTSVLKLNQSRRFYTGVYPYSLLTSVFLPARSDEPALKVAFGAQEWCGTAYQQFNRRNGRYHATLHSYFQAEADRVTEVDGLLEDDLWVRARRGPEALPVGELALVPAAHALRLSHEPARALPATASLRQVRTTPRGEEPAWEYTIRYTDWARAVTLYYEREFPYRLLAWEEARPVVGGAGEPTTTAVLTNSFMLDYWRRNSADDGEYRRLLGLEF